jgi:integrase
MPSYADRVRDIFHWIVLFDQQDCDTITPVQIRAQRDRWLTTGPRMRQKGKKKITEHKPLAASTVNHRLRALQNMWTVLWPQQPNPVRQVPEADEPTTVPRAMLPATVQAIFKHLPAHSKSRARLLVMFWTGLPGKTLMRLKREDVDLEAGIIYLPGRKKGAGTHGATLPLLPDAVKAFTELDAVHGWGEFSKSGLRSVFLRACAAAKVSDVTPYHLRHTFATNFLAATKDLRATQKALNHSTAKLTERYAMAAIDPVMLDAYAKMAKVSRRVTTRVTTTQKRP